jgi:Zn-dependent peptidase ImmA (M78 family)
VLRAAWAPDYPDLPAPVDPFYIARGLGIEVYVAVLDQGVSGMLVKRPALDPVIYLNRLDSENRQRFTWAHEIGHYVKRAADDTESFEYVDARGPTASQGSDPDEIYANQFAAALLMPREAVERLVAQGAMVSGMAYRLGVSLEAMNFRLTNLAIRT